MTVARFADLSGIDMETFREAMSRFASGVTIVAATDSTGNHRGFTATAFSSVSGTPPLVLICLDKAATCHPHFVESDRYSVSILREEHWDLAKRFASKGDDKFADDFDIHEIGVAFLPDALAVLICSAERVIDAGDHTVLLGRVIDVRLGDGSPAVYYRRKVLEVIG